MMNPDKCVHGYQALCLHVRAVKKYRRKKKAKTDFNSTQNNVNWTDNEVELLLGVVLFYSSQKDYEGLEW